MRIQNEIKYSQSTLITCEYDDDDGVDDDLWWEL